MIAELARDLGTMAQPAQQLESLPQGVSDLSPVIELYPKLDPMRLTREDFLNLTDGQSRRDVLISLQRDPYNFQQIEQARRLFPEGLGSPLSEIEKRVFASMQRIIDASDGIVLDRDAQTLTEHLQDTSIDQAIEALQKEGVNRRDGHFWATRGEIGGYELNREIAFETERQAKIENTRDEVKMHSLEDMARSLHGIDIQVREEDKAEMERLRTEFEERRRSKEMFWKSQRQKGYKNLIH